MTGFPPEVAAACRRRAQDCCEACGIWLPSEGGNIQHRCARKMGGSRAPVINSVVNAALLCGTPFTGCHGLAERRTAAMHDMGFWLRYGEDPELTPIRLHGLVPGRGRDQWLTPDGDYADASPLEAAA